MTIYMIGGCLALSGFMIGFMTALFFATKPRATEQPSKMPVPADDETKQLMGRAPWPF